LLSVVPPIIIAREAGEEVGKASAHSYVCVG